MNDYDIRYIQKEIQLTPMRSSSLQRSTHGMFSQSGLSNIKKERTSSIQTPPSIIIQLNQQNMLNSNTEIIVSEFTAIPFRRRYYLLEIVFTYAFLIAINYLIKLFDLQYIAIIACIALFQLLGKFKYDNLLVFCLVPILIGNCFSGVGILTPLQIVCGYLSVAVFQSLNIMDRLYPIFICLILAVYGFIILPIVYSALASVQYGQFIFYYIFPLIDFGVELLSDLLIFQLKHPARIHYMVNLAQIGIYFGVSMKVSMGSVQFWYLCVLLSIRAINSKQQIVSYQLRKLYYKLRNKKRTPNRNISYKSGYLVKMNTHIVLVVFIYGYLNFSNQPFVYLNKNTITMYELQNAWYQPLIFAAISFSYDIIFLIINRKKPDHRKKILLQDRNPSDSVLMNVLKQAYYSLINIFGLWMFYVGYCIPTLLISQTTTQ